MEVNTPRIFWSMCSRVHFDLCRLSTWQQSSPSWLVRSSLSGCRYHWTPCHRGPGAPSGSSSASRPPPESVWTCGQEQTLEANFIPQHRYRFYFHNITLLTTAPRQPRLLLCDRLGEQSLFAFIPLFHCLLLLLKLLQARLFPSAVKHKDNLTDNDAWKNPRYGKSFGSNAGDSLKINMYFQKQVDQNKKIWRITFTMWRQDVIWYYII